MDAYSEWREGEVKRIGLDKQMKAEALLDKHASEPIVERNNEKTGAKSRYRRNVAERLEARGEVSREVIVSAPSQAYKDNYDKIQWNREG